MMTDRPPAGSNWFDFSTVETSNGVEHMKSNSKTLDVLLLPSTSELSTVLSPLSPRSPSKRIAIAPGWVPWLSLFVVCITQIASYYMYYAVSSNEDAIATDLRLDPVVLGSLFSYYSLPNIFLVILGGSLSDAYGEGIVLFSFSMFASFGAILVAFGSQMRSYGIMATGMFFIGLGSECLDNAGNAVVIRWFGNSSSKRLGLPLGLFLFCQNLGTFLAFGLNGQMVTLYRNYHYVLWTASVLGIIAVAAAGMYFLLEKAYVKPPRGSYKEALAVAFNLSHFKELPTAFWLANFATCLYAVAENMMWGWGPTLLSEHGYSEGSSQSIVAVMTLVALVFSAPLGAAFDKIGWRPVAVLVAQASLAVLFVLFGLLPSGSAGLLIAASFLFTLCDATMWPWFGLTIPPHLVGLGIGIEDSVFNLGLTVGFPALGTLEAATNPRTAGPYLFAALLMIAVALTACWWYADVTAPTSTSAPPLELRPVSGAGPASPSFSHVEWNAPPQLAPPERAGEPSSRQPEAPRPSSSTTHLLTT